MGPRGSRCRRRAPAHGTVGLEFDTVIVAGAAEGNFPSLGRPEPMFDLASLERTPSRAESVRARLEDERRLFHVVVGRARRGVVLVCSDTHPDADELTLRTRFGGELGATWLPAPGSPFDEPVSTREATALWRRQLADPSAEDWRRLAALDGLQALRRRARPPGGSSAIGPRPGDRSTSSCASATPGCPPSRTASCSTCSAASSGSAARRATRRGSASSCTA
jgi:Superfamily I DNA and RNA helicases